MNEGVRLNKHVQCPINTFTLFLQGYSRLYHGGLFVPTKVRTGTHHGLW